MNCTINYKVAIPEEKSYIAESAVAVVFNVDQLLRLSQAKGRFLEDDESIKDIYDIAYKAAIESERTEKYGALVGTKVIPVEFELD